MAGKKGMNKGNNNNELFKTSRERKQLCKSYCHHISSGLSKECFPDCDMDTVNRYIKKYPIDLPTKKVKEAERLGRKFWENSGVVGMTQGKAFNATTWIFNMKNRFGWRDKTDITTNDEKVEGIVIFKPEKRKD